MSLTKCNPYFSYYASALSDFYIENEVSVLGQQVLDFIRASNELRVRNTEVIYKKSTGSCKTKRGRPVDRRPSTDEAQPTGKIHPLSKIAVSLEPVMQLECPSRFRIS